MTIDQLHKVLKERTPAPMDATAQFAVLVPLVERRDGLHLLYELRSASLRAQPREVCFPGGGMEPGESAADCALRETWEELGILPDEVQVLGALDFICHRSGFVLYPILGRIQEQALDRMTLNTEEVDQAFTIPLSALRAMAPEEYRYEMIPAPGEDFPYERIGIPRNYPWKRGIESGPIYPWQGKAVWGMTGRITRHVLKLLEEA